MSPRSHHGAPRVVSISSAVACAIVVCACGGGHKASTTKTATTKSAPAPKPAPAVITETAALTTDQQAAASALRASPGSHVVFRTTYPASLAGRPHKVRVRVVRVTPSRWKITVTADGQHAGATVSSSTGKPITLVNLAYSCAAPPTPSICPIKEVHATTVRTEFQFTALPGAPDAITGDVGPITGASPPKPTTSLEVPTYQVKEEVTAIVPAGRTAGSANLVPGITAIVRPGYLVSLATVLRSHIVGAPQPVTIRFRQGPASTITVSAAIPGGPMSRATVKSATGSPIELILPTYRCYLPPTLSSCPVRRVQAAAGRYAFTFDAGPAEPVLLKAQVQAG